MYFHITMHQIFILYLRTFPENTNCQSSMILVNELKLIRGQWRGHSIFWRSRWCITLWQNGVEKTSISSEGEKVFYLETLKTAASNVNKHFPKAFLCWFVSFFDYFPGYPRFPRYPILRIKESLLYSKTDHKIGLYKNKNNDGVWIWGKADKF